MTLRDVVVGQFRKPHGPLGHLAGWIMANRGSNRQRNAWTVDLLDIRPADRILEIGCGPGLALKLCAERAPHGRVVGLDHSLTMLKQARARNAAAVGGGRVGLRLGGLEALEMLPGPFDKVLSANVAQFFADKEAAFRSIFDVLAPGGTVATTYQPRHGNADRSDALRFADAITTHMVSAGFETLRTEELPLRPVPVVCVLGVRPANRG